jgi:pimeloyl-ACP methyl ester carboxylesterase
MTIRGRSVFALCRPWQACLIVFAILALFFESARTAPPSDTLIVREALGITLPRREVSGVLPSTPVDAWLTGDRTDVPKEGSSVRLPDGTEVPWQRVVSDSIGWFSARPPGEHYIAVTIERKSPIRMMLEGMGHDFVAVNGTPRSGNPYQQRDTFEAWEPRFDYSSIPIELRQGQNLLVFRYGRGRLKVRLVPVTKTIAFNVRDLTLPDALIGKALDAWGAIALSNATDATLKGCYLVCNPTGGSPDTVDVPTVPAMGIRKLAFRVRTPDHGEKGDLPVRLAFLGGKPVKKRVIDTVTIHIRVVGDGDSRRETFLSAIDGSVQYYAVRPPQPPGSPERPALFLSLHGAGVEALNQAASYESKPWGYVVAPTNRRPYGFSWEDWGRLDALEVLDLVMKKFSIDASRVYLTGHSMGGHGTWFLGATYPDRFAAIGPSAGWITFHSYRFAQAPPETSKVKNMLRRAEAPSDLFSLVDNYRHFGVYILHGEKDDNVPIEQSFMMIERLKPIDKDFEFHEEPGAGHWWDNSPEPGADCVDWRPMFDFFSRHARPGSDRIRTVEFSTADPGISSRDGWLTIDSQDRQLNLSTVRVHVDPGLNRVQGITTNVSRLAIDKSILNSLSPAMVELDSQRCEVRPADISTDRIWFGKEGGTWHQVNPPSAAVKNARRDGTLKECFRNRMALVYGTSGTPEENHWAFVRARYDAEKLWYQGNASVDVLADTEFVPSKEPDRNVVLYGNSRTHRLWKTLLPGCPVTVDRGRIDLGGTTEKRSDVCCIFIRPRPGSDVASVGVVSGTGIEGFKLSNRVMYLEPGLGLPDLAAFDADVLTKGDEGVIMAGFFGPDWSMQTGEFVGGQH